MDVPIKEPRSIVHKDKILKAQILVEALPYIKRFSGETIVIKFGGSVMVDPELKKQFALDVVLLRYVGMNPIVVHGGGKEISRWMKKVGKEAVFIDGLRFTDSETIEITEMVLSGKVNSEIVSLINQQGGKAVGLSGKSANLYSARRIKSKRNEDLGFVGQIDSVDQSLLDTLFEKSYVPVVSSISSDANGDTLNLNADNVASSIAKHLNAKKLIYLTDVDGLVIEDHLQQRLGLSEAKQLLNHPDVQGGMLPKLDCSVSAIEGNVDQVHMINGTYDHSVLLEIFTDDGIGTMISREIV